MSLFKTKEWWKTECSSSSGSNDNNQQRQQPQQQHQRETFDGQSLLLVRGLFEAEAVHDVIVVVSHAGYLRIYAPHNEWDEEGQAPGPYRSTDLVIEAKLADSILDCRDGRFIS
ncbi:hypothetical protein TKK_0016254 [Trichogramma kaykai]